VNGWTVVPRGAIRVDRATPWRSPFWIDQPYIFTRARLSFDADTRSNRMLMVARLHFAWLMGLTRVEPLWCFLSKEMLAQLPDPPTLLEIEHHLRGKTLADWPALGQPCIGDVLLAIANRRRDGSLYPTPSDSFEPDNSSLSRANRRRDQEYSIGKVGW
jgi:hypothetical protein